MTALRVMAFAIAIVAVIDPALTTSRSSRPLVSVLAPDSARDAALVDRVEQVLARQFTVVRGDLSAAAGTVLVGDEVPESRPASPLMVIQPAHQLPFLRILALEAPATSSLNARIPIVATIQVRGARNRWIDVEILAGEVRVDRELAPTDSDTVQVRASLDQVPTTAGPTLLHFRARIRGTNITDEASTAFDVTDGRLSILFFDPRASWLSTFVRRSLEDDPRFSVTHRVLTSRGLSNASGSAPQSLRDAQSLSRYGTIVVGSPEQLSEADVAGLDAYMRTRGGRVVLLMDRRAAGPIDRLTGVSAWRAARLPSVTNLVEHLTFGPRIAGPSLRAQEILWPATLPAGASEHNVSYAADSTRRAVVWSVPVGAGRLLVSGALDAWHHRDAESGFDTFWSTFIGEQAINAPPALALTLARSAVAPGETTTLTAWIRDAALSGRDQRTASVSAILAGPTDTTTLRLWPDHEPGMFTGTIVAPRTMGTYRIVASSGVERSETPLVVQNSSRAASRDERNLLPAFAASRQGRVIPENELRNLPRALSSALRSVSRVETWYPMRSAWWILPFALLLGAEWWWRRRRGLA